MQALGFGGIEPELGYDAAVINKYFDWYFPLAVRLGRLLDSRPGPERHIYTTHSYLVSLYLACPPAMGLHCPSLERQAELREAISAGYVTWSALPYNGHVEAMDSMLLQSAVHLSKYTDAECGVPQKTVISQVRTAPAFAIGMPFAAADTTARAPAAWRAGLFARGAGYAGESGGGARSQRGCRPRLGAAGRAPQ